MSKKVKETAVDFIKELATLTEENKNAAIAMKMLENSQITIEDEKDGHRQGAVELPTEFQKTLIEADGALGIASTVMAIAAARARHESGNKTEYDLTTTVEPIKDQEYQVAGHVIAPKKVTIRSHASPRQGVSPNGTNYDNPNSVRVSTEGHNPIKGINDAIKRMNKE